MVKRGFRFYHSRVLDENRNPQLYEVTRVAHGVVFYRMIEKVGEHEVFAGAPQCCDLEDFQKWSLTNVGET